MVFHPKQQLSLSPSSVNVSRAKMPTAMVSWTVGRCVSVFTWSICQTVEDEVVSYSCMLRNRSHFPSSRRCTFS